MNPRKITLIVLIFASFLFGDDSIIDLKTFPRPTMNASLLNGEIAIDGNIDEPSWMLADSISDFYQSQPIPGARATERTVVRVLYDSEFLYISAILYDSEPEKIIIESLEEDFESQDNDAFAIMLDTFNDNKSGYAFLFNPAGAITVSYTHLRAHET